jgi:hypothetical protein
LQVIHLYKNGYHILIGTQYWKPVHAAEDLNTLLNDGTLELTPLAPPWTPSGLKSDSMNTTTSYNCDILNSPMTQWCATFKSL